MSVIVAQSVSGSGGGSSGSPTLLYDENPVGVTPPAAQGANSVAIGSGALTSLNAPNSTAVGDQSLARHRGAVVQASGRFGSSGDIQHGKYLLRTVTVDGTPTEAFIDGTGGTLNLILPDDATWTFSITVTAHRTDAGDGHAGFEAKGVVYRASGPSTVAIQGVVTKTTLASSNSNWNINIQTDTTTGSLCVVVKGEAGKIIRWGVLIETLEITN